MITWSYLFWLTVVALTAIGGAVYAGLQQQGVSRWLLFGLAAFAVAMIAAGLHRNARRRRERIRGGTAPEAPPEAPARESGPVATGGVIPEASLRRVLVAVDFSEESEGAIAWGAALAHWHAADLVLAHAVPTPVAPGAMTGAPDAASVAVADLPALRETAEQRLAETASGLPTANEPSIRVGVGDAASYLLEVAEEVAPDLIVAGSRGHAGVARLLLGSTSTRLVQEATCAVLVVRHPGGSGPEAVRNVLIPTDFSGGAAMAAMLVARLLGGRDHATHLTLLHAFERPAGFYRYGTGDELPASVTRERAEVEADLSRLADVLAQPGLEIDTSVEEGPTADVILGHAADHGVDLIAMGSRERGVLQRLFLGSTTRQLLPASPCPVLVVSLPPED